MPEKNLHRWNTVSDYMDSDYREIVVKTALAYREHASRELRTMANSALSNITVPGFRNFQKVPASVAIPYVVKQFYKRREVTESIIGLWSEACQDIINDLKSQACARGFLFKEPWTWKEAQIGYYSYEDVPEFDAIVEVIVTEKEKIEQDHCRLAELWLSAALIETLAPNVEDQEGENRPEILETATSSRVSPEEIPLEGNRDATQTESKTLLQAQETSESQIVDVPVTTELQLEDQWDDFTLVSLIEQGEQIRIQIESQQAGLSVSIQCLQQAVETGDLPIARENIDILLDQFGAWQKQLNYAESLANYGVYRLQRELNLRPDMNHLKHLDHPQLVNLKAGLQGVLEYDDQKQATLKALEQLEAEKTAVEKEWSYWKDTPDTEGNNIPDFTNTDASEVTLGFLREYELELRSRIETLKSQCQRAREASLNHIQSDLAKLSELANDETQPLVDGRTIDQISRIDYSTWDGLQIRHLEAELQKELNYQLMTIRPGKVIDYASLLVKDWSDEGFGDLLSSLAAEHSDAEVFLALITAAWGRENPGSIILPTDVYNSALSGLTLFSGHNEPSDLTGQVLPALVNKYLLEDKNSTADLCVLSLAVYYSASYHFPEDLLWKIATEWPIDGMPGWNKLWQSALLGVTGHIYTDHRQTELREKLAQARAKAEKDFARDGAHFIRLSSLQSYRHLNLMNRLLQNLAGRLESLKQQDGILAKAKPEQLQDLVMRFAELLRNDLDDALSERKLNEMYETGIRTDKIDDSNPFHQRTSLRLLKECAHNIRQYGEALLELWDLTAQRISGLDTETLYSELDCLPNLSNFARMAAQQMIQSQRHNQHDWNEISYTEELKNQLVFVLLTQPNFTLRLPRLVCHLVEHSLHWDEAFKLFLEDMAFPLKPLEIAAYLLAHRVSDQILGLVQFIPLEMQNQAQSLRSEYEHQCDQLTLELLGLGGKADDLGRMREVGRWAWLLNELKTRIEVLRLTAEADAREAENHSRAFRKRIQDLDDAIFDVQAQVPHDAYELVQHGLALARRAYGNRNVFSVLDEYLQEVNYRLTHNSWPFLSLEQATDRLERALAEKQSPDRSNLNAERVLELLECNELDALGLSKIEMSEANTRINLLSNWLKIKKIHSIFGKDLLQTELSTIQSFYSYFARMMSMTRFRTQNEKSLDTIDPIVLEYWEMRFPRTNALDNQYILITLSGDTLSAKDLQTIENILEEKEFLEYYFVLLFVPSCNEKIYKRLQQKGLVVVDERRLLDMILAEANGNNPLGVLRPMVLTAIEANADIFITNQSVNARTAIFVGRENLVDRIVNSGDNYAIYGGRRIGKSSVLKAVEQRLKKRGYRTIPLSLEGEKDFSDDYISQRLAQSLDVNIMLTQTSSFKQVLIDYMENNSEVKLAILLDEVDRYIEVNSERHTLIETLRTCSDRFGDRFRVIIAGFMNLYDCLHGHSPYTPNSDPWQRMFTDNRELENLLPTSAEDIVREGFISILGWKFENWSIPQRIVEHTGGHPAFVQMFCLKLLERVRARKDQTIRLSDVETVFNDTDPRNSFMAYVRDTLNLNLEPVSSYLIIWLAADVGKAPGFTMDKIRYIAHMSNVQIPEERLKRSLDLLKVTSVIRERMPDVFDFTVPDYASILDKLGNTSHISDVEAKLKAALK